MTNKYQYHEAKCVSYDQLRRKCECTMNIQKNSKLMLSEVHTTLWLWLWLDK